MDDHSHDLDSSFDSIRRMNRPHLPSAFPFRSRRLPKNANIVDATVRPRIETITEDIILEDDRVEIRNPAMTSNEMPYLSNSSSATYDSNDHTRTYSYNYHDSSGKQRNRQQSQSRFSGNILPPPEYSDEGSDGEEPVAFDRMGNGNIAKQMNSQENMYNSNILKQYVLQEQTAEDEESVAEMAENREYAHVAGLSYCTGGGDVMFVAPNTPSVPFAEWASTPRSIFSTQSRRSVDLWSVDDKTIFSAAESVMTNNDEIQLRQLAAKLTPEWSGEHMAPALARRLRDFQFAQEKRRKKYGEDKPWGILGLYEHLTSLRVDIAWAEDAAWRRANGQPYLSWSAFEDSKNSGFNKPYFTYLLLFVCSAVLIVSVGVNGWNIESFSVNPMIGPSASTLISLGAKYSNMIVNQNDIWRLVTPMFLHAGLIHYIFNMMALWFVGIAVESIHGFAAASIIFTISAIGGTLLSAIFLPQYISVGASGGIFGLIGSCLADIVMNWHLLFSDFVNEGQKKRNHVLILMLLFLDITANTLLGMTPFVDNFTHIGGMVFGFLCGMSTMERLSADFFGFEETCQKKIKQVTIRFLGLIISMTAIMAGLIVLLEGDGTTSPCSSCSYLSCVPFPPWAADTEKWWFCDDCGNISADAKLNPNTKEFDQLDLNCPDGEITTILLGDEATTDRFWLESNLPTFCRLHCNNVLSH